MSDENYYGVVYKITNLVNGKIYVGQTIHPKRRWRQHKNCSKDINNNTIINKALRKYGTDNFIFEIIENAKSAEELNKLEEFYIKEYNSLIPNGYNLIDYNNGIAILSEESRSKMSDSQRNKKKNNSSSKYFGVNYDKKNKKWKSSLSFNAVTYHIGYFDTEIDAAQARDIESLKDEFKGFFELNFPELKEKYLNKDIKIKEGTGQGYIFKKSGSSSIYMGVSFRKRSNKWICELSYKGEKYHLGEFDYEEDAAKKYDMKAIELIGDKAILNFENLREDYVNGKISLIGNKPKAFKQKTSSSQYYGVSFHKQTKTWCAALTISGKRYRLGYFKEEKEAAIKYNEFIVEYYGENVKLNVIK